MVVTWWIVAFFCAVVILRSCTFMDCRLTIMQNNRVYYCLVKVCIVQSAIESMELALFCVLRFHV